MLTNLAFLIAGAVLGFLTQWGFDKRREHLVARFSAEIIEEELTTAVERMDQAMAAHMIWPASEPLVLEAWDSHRRDVRGKLSDAEFFVLRHAYRHLDALNDEIAALFAAIGFKTSLLQQAVEAGEVDAADLDPALPRREEVMRQFMSDEMDWERSLTFPDPEIGQSRLWVTRQVAQQAITAVHWLAVGRSNMFRRRKTPFVRSPPTETTCVCGHTFQSHDQHVVRLFPWILTTSRQEIGQACSESACECSSFRWRGGTWFRRRLAHLRLASQAPNLGDGDGPES